MTDGPAAGWYPDPLQRFDHRYWDGSAWTHHVSRGGEATLDHSATAATEVSGSTAASRTADGTAATDRSMTETTVAGAHATDASLDPTSARTSAVETAAGSAPAESFAALGATPEQTARSAAAGGPQHVAPRECAPSTTSPATWQPATPMPTTNGKAVGSLIASIVWVGGLASIVGIVLGVMGRREVERSGGRETGAGIAMAGIVIGALGILSTIAVALIVGAVMRAVDGGGLTDTFGPDVSIEGTSEDAESDLAYSLVDVDFHQDRVLDERGRYAETVDELLQVGWIVSQTVEVVVFADGAKSWCVEAVSELDPAVRWAVSSTDVDGPGPGAC